MNIIYFIYLRVVCCVYSVKKAKFNSRQDKSKKQVQYLVQDLIKTLNYVYIYHYSPFQYWNFSNFVCMIAKETSGISVHESPAASLDQYLCEDIRSHLTMPFTKITATYPKPVWQAKWCSTLETYLAPAGRHWHLEGYSQAPWHIRCIWTWAKCVAKDWSEQRNKHLK